MPRTFRESKLFSDFNTLQFASVMGIVVFIVLLMFMTAPAHYHHISVDLPYASHPVSMRGADREDAMKVWVRRDGNVFFGDARIDPAELPAKISEHLKDHTVERKVYVYADARARWASVKAVLEGIRSTGVLRVAFLAYQRKA